MTIHFHLLKDCALSRVSITYNRKIGVGRFLFFNRPNPSTRGKARGKNRLVPRAFEEVLRQRISTSRGDACQNRKSGGSRRDEEKKEMEKRRRRRWNGSGAKQLRRFESRRVCVYCEAFGNGSNSACKRISSLLPLPIHLYYIIFPVPDREQPEFRLVPLPSWDKRSRGCARVVAPFLFGKRSKPPRLTKLEKRRVAKRISTQR